MARSLDDDTAFIRVNRDFHETLVHLCGNETMKIMLGAVEELWAQQEHTWVEQALAEADRKAALRAHARIIDLIEAGDDTEVYRLAVRHLESAQEFPLRGNPAVRAPGTG
jgi:DNA-binding GntR family transcriptional regulator